MGTPLLILGLSAAAMAAMAQTGNKSEATAPRAATAAAAEVRALKVKPVKEREALVAETRLRELIERHAELRKQVEKGTARPADLHALDAQIAAVRQEAERVAQTATRQGSLFGYVTPGTRVVLSPEQLRERQRLLGLLERRIDVDLRNASVRQAARVMSEASTLNIEVDRSVPADKRLTISAQSVPLRTVLESVARQTGLMIAPEANGVRLRPMASLEVNGKRTNFRAPFAPWTSDWGMIPGRAPANVFEVPFASTPGAPPARVFESITAGRLATGSVAMTSMGDDTLIVAHPAPAGSEPGTILSVYRLENGQLRLISSTLHRFNRSSSTPSGSSSGSSSDR